MPVDKGVSHSGTTDALLDLLQTYHDLNPCAAEELDAEPSPLEFMRFVARNRPFVVRGGVSHWAATAKWNAEYLVKVMGSKSVNVAITPHGNADSVVTRDGKMMFAKPLEATMPFDQFLNDIRNQELALDDQGPVKYAQTQNDNLRNEYQQLYKDVEEDIAWARVALEKRPDAINLWIGNSRSVSALHKDSYENIYCQIIGSKHFVLLPPVEVACVEERNLPAASYVDTAEGLVPFEDDPRQDVPFPTWDPDNHSGQGGRFSHLSRPLRVTLNRGDLLYLPALWYHKVSQSCSSEGLSCAVNYWYDMDFSGTFYPLCNLARQVASLSAPGTGQDANSHTRSNN